MSISVSNESKNSLSVSNEAKLGDTTWAAHTETWAEAGAGGGTWAINGTPALLETKNNLTTTNETKN